LFIIPYCHAAKLYELSAKEHTELIEIATLYSVYFEKNLKASGANIGLNLGKAAGAGIPNHLHIHLLPRNIGDIGFLQITTNTGVIDFNLSDFYKKMKLELETLLQKRSAN